MVASGFSVDLNKPLVFQVKTPESIIVHLKKKQYLLHASVALVLKTILKPFHARAIIPCLWNFLPRNYQCLALTSNYRCL